MSREQCMVCGIFKDIALYDRCEKDTVLYGILPVYGYHRWMQYVSPVKFYGRSIQEDLEQYPCEDFRGPGAHDEDEWAWQ